MSLQEQLYTYFELDQRLRAMRARLDNAERRHGAQSRKLGQLKQAAEELDQRLKTAQAHLKTLENEATSIEERVTAQRDKMNSATNNKEYSALLIEVNTLKADKAKIDDTMLEEMGAAESLTSETTAINEQVQAQSRLVDGATKEIEEAKQEIGGKLEELQAEREAAADVLAPEIRKTFDRLADTYDGEAMAEIQEQDRRRMEYTCGGCFTLLPVESVNALITKPDVLTTCGTCNRILYVGEQLRNSLADAKS